MFDQPFQTGMRVVDLELYYGIDYAHSEPTITKNQGILINPNGHYKLPLFSEQKPFTTEYIYLGIHSQTGCELFLTLTIKERIYRKRTIIY